MRVIADLTSMLASDSCGSGNPQLHKIRAEIGLKGSKCFAPSWNCQDVLCLDWHYSLQKFSKHFDGAGEVGRATILGHNKIPNLRIRYLPVSSISLYVRYSVLAIKSVFDNDLDGETVLSLQTCLQRCKKPRVDLLSSLLEVAQSFLPQICEIVAGYSSIYPYIYKRIRIPHSGLLGQSLHLLKDACFISEDESENPAPFGVARPYSSTSVTAPAPLVYIAPRLDDGEDARHRLPCIEFTVEIAIH